MTSSADSFSPRELAELSALADGTLAAERRTAVEARIAASPQLSDLYARERRAVELLHQSSATVRAPASLRARIEAQRPRRAVRASRRAIFAGGAAMALGAAALALVLLLPAGSPGSPSVSEAARLAVRGPTSAAPATNATSPAKLERQVEDVYFPNWATQFGWRATGQRIDRINGRVAVTVYYEWRGARLAYTIVGAPALKAPRGHFAKIGGTEFRALTLGGRRVMTWRRSDHTCILSGVGVPTAELQRLAAWKTPNE